MTSVGIRELRQRTSELLRRVELRALGAIEPAKAELDDLPKPLVLPRGVERPSSALRRLREHER